MPKTIPIKNVLNFIFLQKIEYNTPDTIIISSTGPLSPEIKKINVYKAKIEIKILSLTIEFKILPYSPTCILFLEMVDNPSLLYIWAYN